MLDLPAQVRAITGKATLEPVHESWYLIVIQVGRLDSDKPAAIRLSGESIKEDHCWFENNDGKVTLHASPDAVTVCQ